MACDETGRQRAQRARSSGTPRSPYIIFLPRYFIPAIIARIDCSMAAVDGIAAVDGVLLSNEVMYCHSGTYFCPIRFIRQDCSQYELPSHLRSGQRHTCATCAKRVHLTRKNRDKIVTYAQRGER